MSPMAAPQAHEEGPGRSAFPAPCLSNQEFAKPLVCKTESPAVTQRKLGSGIFTPQLWKAVGLVPKQLEPTPVQCAALTTPKSASASARPPLPPPFSSGGGRRLMSGSTFSGELSFGSVSSTGCVSMHMASCDINPKSLKSAAIMAFEASAAEGSDASGALSDSTGVSPGHLHGGSGGVVTSGRPLGGPGRQRSLGLSGGSSLSREAGPVRASAAAAAAATSPPYLQHMASGASHSSFGATGVGGCVAGSGSGGGGTAGWNVAAPGLAAAPSLAARSDGGSSDTATVYTGDLHECLLCGLKSCFPTGPATIRCSDCKGTMHRDCFIAHYQVVPGRRDWTYCPVHSQVLKNRLPAKPRPVATGPRRGSKDKDSRPQQQQRKRPRLDGGAFSDAAGDREFTAGPGFERVPSGSRSQRARRAANGGSAALAAAGMAAGCGDVAAAATGSGAFSAVASPASSDGGNGDAAEADAALPPPQRRFVSSRGRESRPVRRQYDSDADAEAATPRAGGNAGGGNLLGASLASGDAPVAACGASPMDTDDAAAAAPASPIGNSESGSAAEPDSPTAANAAARASDKTAARRSAANAADGKGAPPALSVGRSRSVARPQQAGTASPRGPTSPRLRVQPPHSPRAGNGSGSQQKGDDGGSGGGRKAAARGGEASKGREQRPVPASPRARAMPKAPAAAAAAPPAAAPAPAKTPAEMNDEELAMLLHQELNASSRRRGQRLPGAL